MTQHQSTVSPHRCDTSRNDLAIALDDFREATSRLNAAWSFHAGDAIANYPSCLPSFDEFALEVAEMHVRPVARFGVGTRVRFTRELGQTHVTPRIPAGETGTVVETEDARMRVRLDGYFPALDEWQNGIDVGDWDENDEYLEAM